MYCNPVVLPVACVTILEAGLPPDEDLMRILVFSPF